MTLLRRSGGAFRVVQGPVTGRPIKRPAAGRLPAPDPAHVAVIAMIAMTATETPRMTITIRSQLPTPRSALTAATGGVRVTRADLRRVQTPVREVRARSPGADHEAAGGRRRERREINGLLA